MLTCKLYRNIDPRYEAVVGLPRAGLIKIAAIGCRASTPQHGSAVIRDSAQVAEGDGVRGGWR